jgi:SPP1 family predicted phage head-tail adaptor
MRAGALRRRAQLQAPVDDGHGGFSLGWTTQATVWAELVQPIGPDMPLAEDTDVTHQVNVRYYAALTPHWRILIDGLELHVRSIQNPDEHKREHSVMCSLAYYPHPLVLQKDIQAIDISVPAYNPATTYAAGTLVLSSSLTYSSVLAGNFGNSPAISPTWWAAARTLADAYGQPVLTAPAETPFMGWLLGRSAAEIVQSNWEGAAIDTDLLVAPPTLPIAKDDHLRWDVDGDLRVYEVFGEPRAVRHHLETDIRLVVA